MIPIALQHDRTAVWTFSLSLSIHLLAILLFTNMDLLRSAPQEAIPYYVDIVSLPALDPAAAGGQSATAPPIPAPAAKPPPPAQKAAMSLPGKQLPAKPATAPSAAADKAQRDEEAREFSERMNRLEHGSDARHKADALASLQKRAAAKKGAGGAPVSGVDKGSDYAAYIQSRLQDALGSTIVYRSQKPEAAVHLYIDKTGKLLRYVMIRPSADKLFNNSVIRTIEKAKADFPPVPSGTGFDKLYVFSPQEVNK